MGPKTKTRKGAKVGTPTKVATKLSSPASRPVSPPPPPTVKKKRSELEAALDAAATPPPPATPAPPQPTAKKKHSQLETAFDAAATPPVPTTATVPPDAAVVPAAPAALAVGVSAPLVLSSSSDAAAVPRLSPVRVPKRNTAAVSDLATVSIAASRASAPPVQTSTATAAAHNVASVAQGTVAHASVVPAKASSTSPSFLAVMMPQTAQASADSAMPASASSASSSSLRLEASRFFHKVAPNMKDALQLAVEPPLFPPLLAKPSTSQEVKIATLARTAHYAMPLTEHFEDADAIFNNGDAIHRWSLLRAAHIFIVRRHGSLPWLILKDVQLAPRTGAVSQRTTVLGNVAASADFTRVTILSTPTNESSLRANLQGSTVEKLKAHPRDPIASYVVDATTSVQTALKRIAFSCPSSNICSSSTKGATIKFGSVAASDAVKKLWPLTSRHDCWLRQSSLRVFAPYDQLLTLKIAVEADGFDIRLDDKRRQPTEWSPQAATASTPPATRIAQQWAIMSTTPIPRTMIDAVCKEIGATPDYTTDFSFICCRITWKKSPPKGEIKLDVTRFPGTIVCRLGDVPCGAPPRQ